MKILKIEYLNDEKMHNLQIDFSKTNGEPYNKIVIVGNNGSGKTTILKDLNELLKSKGLRMNRIEYLNDSNEELIIESNDKSKETGFYDLIKESVKNRIIINAFGRINSEDDIRKHGVVYSKVQVNFKTNQIKSIGSMDINVDDKDEFGNDDDSNFTKIKQLLIDLSSQDSENFSNMHEIGNPISKLDFNLNYSKVYRFKKAINEFLDDIQFVSIETTNSHKDVIFQKNGTKISIDSLSTGEKQIVFRGVYLLKNIDLHENGFVLIDEPELSMHPIWEDKLFKYYSDLLFNTSRPVGQLFIATHSERILKSALFDPNTLVIEIKNENGNVKSIRYDSPLVLPYKSDAEINLKVFGIYSNDLHLQLFDYIQTSNGFTKIKDVDSYIAQTLEYNSNINLYHHPSSFVNPTNGNVTNYDTICTKVRNKLHHGKPNEVSYSDLKASIDLMYKICGGSLN